MTLTIADTVSTPGAAAHQAAQHKIAKYCKLAAHTCSTPVHRNSRHWGTWDDMAIELVEEIGRRTTIITQDTRETVFLFQRLSGSAARECGLLPQHNEQRRPIRSRCSRCLTFCLVFTPRLCTGGHYFLKRQFKRANRSQGLLEAF